MCLPKPSKTKAPVEFGLQKPSETKAPMEMGFPRPSKTKAPMEMGLPKPFVITFKQSPKYQMIFPRQNVVSFNTKLITFWPIA